MISVPSVWRLSKERYKLIGTKCLTCNTIYLPPRGICPKCRRKGKLEKFTDFSGLGKIETWTVVHSPPQGFEELSPYVLAIVKLDEGPRVLSQIVDVKPDDIKQGMRVEIVIRRIQEENPDGIIVYGFKFRPVI